MARCRCMRGLAFGATFGRCCIEGFFLVLGHPCLSIRFGSLFRGASASRARSPGFAWPRRVDVNLVSFHDVYW